MIKFLFISAFSLLFFKGLGQKDGEWFARKGKGVTVFSFSKNHIVTEDKRDSINAPPIKKPDSLTIVDKINRNGFDYYILKQSMYDFSVYSAIKIRIIDENSFLNCLSINVEAKKPNGLDTSVDGILKRVESDTFPYLSITCFSKDSLIKAKSLKHIRTATKKEFISILNDMIKSSESIKNFVNKELNGQVATIFWYSSLIKGNIETMSLLRNKFSPFFTREDYDFLKAKYGKKLRVKKRLKKLET